MYRCGKNWLHGSVNICMLVAGNVLLALYFHLCLYLVSGVPRQSPSLHSQTP